MERRGEAGGAGEVVAAAAGVDEVDGAFPLDEVADADAAVEVEEVGAAAEEDVLAVVEGFAGLGFFEGTGAPAEDSACFEEGDVEACGFEGDGGGHAGEAATDDDDARRPGGGGVGGKIGLTPGRARSARQPMRSLDQRERETRWRRTRFGRALIFSRRAW